MTSLIDNNKDEPAPKGSKSGKVIGSEYVQTFRAYLANASTFPCNEDGSLSISAIADASAIPRQSFYKNPQLKSMLDDIRGAQSESPKQTSEGLREPYGIRSEGAANKKAKVLERRVNQLEQQNAALVAENGELRRQLKLLRLQMGREEMSIETGRRIPVPAATRG
jgi:hypothetical protein